MEIATSTVYMTGTAWLTFTPTATIEAVTTITTEYRQTYTATLGQTITVLPSWPPQTLLNTAIPNHSSDLERTVTQTEVVVLLEDWRGIPYSTWTAPVTATSTDDSIPGQESSYLLVVDPDRSSSSGWNSWNSAQRGGLIAGTVIAFLLIVLGSICVLLKRRSVWIANDWNVRSHPDWGIQQPGQILMLPHPAYYH